MGAKRKVLVRDTTPPMLSWTVGYGSQIVHRSESGNTMDDPGVVCRDSCDLREHKKIQYEWVGLPFNDLAPGTYKRRYTCWDHFGNKNTIDRDFVVVDRDAPNISLIGNSSIIR